MIASVHSSGNKGGRLLLFAFCVSLIATLAVPGIARETPGIPIMRAKDLRPGMKGYGRTVFKGTRVEQFPVTILGVVKNYIAESDLILIRVDGGYPAKHGIGIVAGMSGSPVWVNGRLIGAIAYGWPFSKEPVGGVTPIESMMKELPGRGSAHARGSVALVSQPRELPEPIHIGDRAMRQVLLVSSAADAKSMHPARDTIVLSPVPSLLQVNGFGERAFRGIENALRPLNVEPVRTFTSAAPVKSAVPPMVPGAAVGVELLTGDLEIAGTGTLTVTVGQRFLAFGHPLAQLGDVALPLTASYIQDILPSYSRPFKFASQIGPVGQLSSDRLWGVGGYLGRNAPMIPVSIHVSDASRGLRKSYRLRVIQHRFLTPTIVTQAMMEGLSTMIPMGADTTAIVDYHLKPRGRKMIDIQQMAAGTSLDASVALQFNEYVAELTNNDFEPLALESVEVDVRIIPGKKTAVIEKIYTTRTSVRRGDDVDVHVVMRPYGQAPFEKVVKIPVPPDANNGPIAIGVAGGNDVTLVRKRLALAKPVPTNIDQLLDLMVHQERGQQLVVKAAYQAKAAVIGQERLVFLPEAFREVLSSLPQSDVIAEKDYFERRIDTEWVVRGAEVINAEVTVGSEGASKTRPDVPNPTVFATVEDDTLQPVDIASTPPAVRVPLPRKISVTRQDKKIPDTIAVADKIPPSGTRRWDIHDAAAFARGRFDATGLSTDGDVSLVGRAEALMRAGGNIVLSLARDPKDGTVLAGTATQGKVLRLLPDAKKGPSTRPTLKVGDAAVTAIAAASDGTIWIGTAPHGRMFRKTAESGPQLVHEANATYVWTILPQPDGGVLVGTGNPAALLSVSSDGTTAVLHRFTERHVRAIAKSAQGETFVVTANPGVVYRLGTGPGQPPTALFTTRFGSADALLVRADGEIVVASGKMAYRMRPDGRLRAVAVADKPLLGLADLGDGQIAAASANGRVYAIDAHDVTTCIADFQGGPVMAVLGGSELLAATAAPDAIVRLSRQPSREGAWTSEVLDAGSGAHWGRARWMSEGSVVLKTRSGFTPTPDESWSNWSDDYTLANGVDICSPPGRYLQVRARLAVGSEAARLTSVSVFFRNDGLQPAIEIAYPHGGARLSGNLRIMWKVSGAALDAVSYDISCSRDGTHWISIQKGIGPTINETALHTAEGPMVLPPFVPGLRPQAAADAFGAVQTEEYVWDTRKVPDGTYRIRIEARDARDSADANPTVIVSKPFVVTNAPPDIGVLVSERTTDGRIRVRGVAYGHLAAVASVAFRQGQRKWQLARPEDGTYDSEREPFSFVVTGDDEVEIKVIDEAGNSRTLRKDIRSPR